MNRLYRILGIKWKRPLKWYDRLLLIWVSLALFGLTIDMDSVPFWAVLLIVANLCTSFLVSANVLPELEDEEEK